MTITIQIIGFILISVITFIIFIIAFTGKIINIPVENSFYVLGTIVHFKVYGKNASKAIDEANFRLNALDDKMSIFKTTSELSKINKNAGMNFQSISQDTFLLIKKALEYSELTGGCYDPTIKPLVSLWGIGTNFPKIPTDHEIANLLKLVDYKDIMLNEAETSVKLTRPHQSIDLGGIAKGYAADEVKNIFAENHIKSAIIDLGGNIFAMGKKNGENPWSIGIQDPSKPRGEHLGVIKVINKSVVTSGNYERYFMKDKKIFHHIIDPKTGYPSESKVISATIVSDTSIDGDGLSTGVYIMGLSKAMELIESINGVDAIFITEDKEIYVTSGLKDNFILSNKAYILK